MIFAFSHLALTIALLLTAYLGVKFVKLSGRHRHVGYSMFILAAGFLIRNIFDLYNLFMSYYWILPEALLLFGITGLTYSLTKRRAKENEN